jgi:hypothetical protein
MKLKIKCNGDPQSAVVVNAATDEIVENVVGVEISLTPFEVGAALILKCVELDLDNIEAEEIERRDTQGNERGSGTSDD